MPWAFLAVSSIGAWFTINAHVPLHRRPLNVLSFAAGWLTTELAGHHLVWQVAATAGFIAAGALEAPAGWVGLGLTLSSWGGLLALIVGAGRAAHFVEEALVEGLDPDLRSAADAGGPTASLSPSRLIVPFYFPDRSVRRTHDIEYLPGGGWRRSLDVYAPRAGVRDAPVLLQVHGGAWIISEKGHQALPLMHHLAARGWVCVAANYRLSPAATFPEHLIDLKHALRWIRENIAAHGGDPGFIAATGGSAGGHLSALLALTAGDPEYQPGFEDVDTKVQACVPFYGVYDFTDRTGHQPDRGMQRFLERTVMKKRFSEDPESFERASPIHRIHAEAPPFFVIHGSHDTLAPVGEAREFARRLRETSKAPVAYAELPVAQHAFEIFHSPRSHHVIRGVDHFLSAIHARRRGR